MQRKTMIEVYKTTHILSNKCTKMEPSERRNTRVPTRRSQTSPSGFTRVGLETGETSRETGTEPLETRVYRPKRRRSDPGPQICR